MDYGYAFVLLGECCIMGNVSSQDYCEFVFLINLFTTGHFLKSVGSSKIHMLKDIPIP